MIKRESIALLKNTLVWKIAKNYVMSISSEAWVQITIESISSVVREIR